MRIMHVITTLGRGGAEAMLLKLLSAGKSDFAPVVVSLGDEGPIGKEISRLGIPVHSLNLSRKWPNPVKVLSIIPLVRRWRPQLIQGWMPHGNFMSVLAAMSLRNRIPVLWNIRMSLYDPASEPKRTEMLIRLGARLSWYPAKIIYNTRIGARQHEELGYRAAKTVILPNGFDCQILRPSDEARRSLRADLGITCDAVLVGLIARYHPMKDHANFIRAAGLVARQHPNARFLLAGTGVVPAESRLVQVIADAQLQGRVFLLGERADIPRLNAALDIACSASAWGEGFSNTIGEAMACGVPCVATDIGDSGFIIGDTGLLVPRENPQALAEAIGRLVSAGADYRKQRGAAARLRVEQEFSLDSVARRYHDLYCDVLASQ